MKKILILLLVLSLVPAMMFAAGAKDEPAAADGKAGGVLVFAHSGDAVGLDPARETDGESFMIADNIYNCLVEFEPGSTAIIPGLAESWDVADNGLEYVFHLREGVKFHDGTDFNADEGISGIIFCKNVVIAFCISGYVYFTSLIKIRIIKRILQ